MLFRSVFPHSFGEVTGQRVNNFDLLRLTLAVVVIFSHSYLLTGNAPRELFLRLVNGQSSASTYAVGFFFAISGFLVTGSWQRSSDGWTYLRKRSLRIFPGLAVAMFFSYLVAAPLGSGQPWTYWQSAECYRFLRLLLPVPINDGSFVHNVTHAANGSLWTIPCELIMYLLVLALGVSGVLHRRRWVLAGGIGAWLAYRGLGRLGMPEFGLPYFGNWQLLLHFLTYFLTGVTLALYPERVPRSRWLLAGALGVLAACHAKGLTGVMPIAGVYVLFYAAYSSVRMPGFKRWGDISYGTYLYAFPIQQLLLLAWPELSPWALFALATPISLGAGALSWRFVERPFLTGQRHPLFGREKEMMEVAA